jgi:hypothetical protein
LGDKRGGNIREQSENRRMERIEGKESGWGVGKRGKRY